MQKLLDVDRMAPHSTEAEEALLGSILLNPAALFEVAFLDERDFFIVRNAWVWAAIVRLHNRNEQIDYITVIEELRHQEHLEDIGGAAYITYLINHTPSSIYTETYGRIVERAAIRRRMLNAASQIAQLAHKEDVDIDEIMESFDEVIFGVAQKRGNGRAVPGSVIASEVFDRVSEAYTAHLEGKQTGLKTGFTDFDRLTGGLQDSDFVVIAGRPSMGKTSLLLAMMLNIVRQKIPCALFSLEMDREQVHQRFVSMETGIEMLQMRGGAMSEQEFASFTEINAEIGGEPFWVDDTPATRVAEMRAECRRLHHAHGIQAVFVDYLQLATAGGGGKEKNRTWEVGEISRGLKQIARELRVPVIAAAQLNRGVEGRQEKRPYLSDLRESGDIENNADIVGLLYRDDYYNLNTEQPNVAELRLAKHRNGPLGTVELFFRKERALLTNLVKENVELGDY